MNVTFIGANAANYSKGRTWAGVAYKPVMFVLHWMDGTLASTDKTFQNPSRKASAHFGIGADGTEHQYVQIADTAYGAGDWFVNLKSINIEHEGAPGIAITEACYEASADLIVTLCNAYNIVPSHDTMKGHKEVSDKPTACPGTLDIDHLIALVELKLNQNVLAAAPFVPPHKTVTVTVNSLYLRISPEVRTDNHSTVSGKPDVITRGNPCDYDTVVIGQEIDGNNLWLHKPDGLYCWAGGTSYQPNQV